MRAQHDPVEKARTHQSSMSMVPTTQTRMQAMVAVAATAMVGLRVATRMTKKARHVPKMPPLTADCTKMFCVFMKTHLHSPRPASDF